MRLPWLRGGWGLGFRVGTDRHNPHATISNIQPSVCEELRIALRGSVASVFVKLVVMEESAILDDDPGIQGDLIICLLPQKPQK